MIACKTCVSCKNWIDATAECAVQLRAIANNQSTPASVDAALELDSKAANLCESWE